jgi:hypothetical protein
MKNKLLKLLHGEIASRRGKGDSGLKESSDWMKAQILKMDSLKQEIISVKAVRQ